MRHQLEEMLSRHSGRDLDLVKKDIDRDKILNAEEAKDYGLIDTVITSRKKSLVSAGK
jgi:ATP-dependent Clp protease, protease subunit